MSAREGVWVLGQLTIAGALLFWDVRAFLFLAFVLLLVLMHQVKTVRALVRYQGATTDAKVLAVAAHLGVTEEDIDGLFERKFAALTDAERDVFRHDLAKVVMSMK